MESRYIETNGIKLHCKVAGADHAPLMILLHGFPEFWYSWRELIPDLARTYRVVAPDMRGYNLSDKPKGVNNYRMEFLVDDIRFLINALGEEKATIVGHDWGGGVAWMLAAFFPECVSRLVILNSPHPLEMKKQFGKNIRQSLRSWYMGFFQIPFLPEMFLNLSLDRFFKRSFKSYWPYNPKQFHTQEDIDRYVAAFKQPYALTASINYYRALRKGAKRSDGIEAHKKLPMPIMIIWGEDDKFLGKELNDNVQDYCEQPVLIHYIERCSHWVQHEYPRRVVGHIFDFMDLSDQEVRLMNEVEG